MSESHSGDGEAGIPSATTDKDPSVCPTCGRNDFKTARGMKIHHKKTHGESIAGVLLDCDWCGETVRKQVSALDRDNHFCDFDCYGKWASENYAGTNHPCWSGEILECSWCGDEYPVSQYRVRISRYCSRECKDESMTELTGPAHPKWKGGSNLNYRGDWYKNRKRRLELDDHQCAICGRDKEETGEDPHVHHITPVTDYDDPNDAHTVENLISLCRQHHEQWEGLYLRPDIR